MKRERPTSPESVSSDLRRAHHAHRQDRPSERACASSLYAGAKLAIASATRPAYCSVSSNDGLITPAVRRPSAGSHAGDCTCVYGRAAAEQCAHRLGRSITSVRSLKCCSAGWERPSRQECFYPRPSDACLLKLESLESLTGFPADAEFRSHCARASGTP